MIFLVGALGGAANELLHWWGLRYSDEFPAYARRLFYWLITMAMILLGGGIALMQLGGGGEPFLAFQVGLLAPMLLKKMSTLSPETQGAMGADAAPTLRKFLRG